MENFGQILDTIINRLNINQIDLSKKFGLSESSVSLDRKSFLTERRLKKYFDFMEYYGIKKLYMLEGNGPMFIDGASPPPKKRPLFDTEESAVSRKELKKLVKKEMAEEVSEIKSEMRKEREAMELELKLLKKLYLEMLDRDKAREAIDNEIKKISNQDKI